MLVQGKFFLSVLPLFKVAAEPVREIPAQIRHIFPFFSPEKSGSSCSGFTSYDKGKTIVHRSAQQRRLPQTGMAHYRNAPRIKRFLLNQIIHDTAQSPGPYAQFPPAIIGIPREQAAGTVLKTVILIRRNILVRYPGNRKTVIRDFFHDFRR